MSVTSKFKEVFSLSHLFYTAVVSVPLFLALGAVDLHVWHYMEGGVYLFDALQQTLFEDNFLIEGLSSMFSSMAEFLGGGAEVVAEKAGGTLDPETGGFLPGY